MQPRWWRIWVVDKLQAISHTIKANQTSHATGRQQWLCASLAQLPAGMFVWRDEFETAHTMEYGPEGARARSNPEGFDPSVHILNFNPHPDPAIATLGMVLEGFNRAADGRPFDFPLTTVDAQRWQRFGELSVEEAAFVVAGFEPPPISVIRYRPIPYQERPGATWARPNEYDDFVRAAASAIERGIISARSKTQDMYTVQLVELFDVLEWAEATGFTVALKLDEPRPARKSAPVQRVESDSTPAAEPVADSTSNVPLPLTTGDIAKLLRLRESFFNVVAGPAGLHRESAKLRGEAKRWAVAAVLTRCETMGLPAVNGPLWPVLVAAIGRDPTDAVRALGIELSAPKDRQSQAEPNPIGIEGVTMGSTANPIGIEKQGQKIQSLSCVGIAPLTTLKTATEPHPGDTPSLQSGRACPVADAPGSREPIKSLGELWQATVPPHGPMRGVFGVPPVPPHGHLSKEPSTASAAKEVQGIEGVQEVRANSGRADSQKHEAAPRPTSPARRLKQLVRDEAVRGTVRTKSTALELIPNRGKRVAMSRSRT